MTGASYPVLLIVLLHLVNRSVLSIVFSSNLNKWMNEWMIGWTNVKSEWMKWSEVNRWVDSNIILELFFHLRYRWHWDSRERGICFTLITKNIAKAVFHTLIGTQYSFSTQEIRLLLFWMKTYSPLLHCAHARLWRMKCLPVQGFLM